MLREKMTLWLFWNISVRYEKNPKTPLCQGAAESYQLDVMSVIMTALGIHIPKQDIVAMTWNMYYCH